MRPNALPNTLRTSPSDDRVDQEGNFSTSPNSTADASRNSAQPGANPAFFAGKPVYSV
jgi:hypothetical protein